MPNKTKENSNNIKKNSKQSAWAQKRYEMLPLLKIFKITAQNIYASDEADLNEE